MRGISLFERAGTPLSLNAVMLRAAIGTGMIPVEPKLIQGAIEVIVPRGAAKVIWQSKWEGGYRAYAQVDYFL